MPPPEKLTELHQNLDFHYPKAYLNAWAQGVRPDWARFLFKVFKENVPSFFEEDRELSVMDLGCGPSICNIISASICSNKIYLAELLEGNRNEIIKYLCRDADAWNWQPYFEFQASLENDEDESSIEKRVRRSITGILECNLASDNVFEPDVFNKKVDIMICSLVFDVVCTEPGALAIVMSRALKFLSEDGIMIIQGSLGEHHYSVGSALLPVLDIQKDEFMDVVEKLNLEILNWSTTERCSTHYFTILRRKSSCI